MITQVSVGVLNKKSKLIRTKRRKACLILVCHCVVVVSVFSFSLRLAVCVFSVCVPCVCGVVCVWMLSVNRHLTWTKR